MASRFIEQEANESQALALIICDHIILDAVTGKRSLIGIFSSIKSPGFPAAMTNFSIYVAIARNASEDSTFFLGVIAPDGQFVVQSQLQVADWGQRGVAEFDLRLPGLVIASPGDHLVRLFVDGRVLRERKLDVEKLPEPPPEQADSPTP